MEVAGNKEIRNIPRFEGNCTTQDSKKPSLLKLKIVPTLKHPYRGHTPQHPIIFNLGEQWTSKNLPEGRDRAHRGQWIRVSPRKQNQRGHPEELTKKFTRKLQ